MQLKGHCHSTANPWEHTCRSDQRRVRSALPAIVFARTQSCEEIQGRAECVSDAKRQANRITGSARQNAQPDAANRTSTGLKARRHVGRPQTHREGNVAPLADAPFQYICRVEGPVQVRGWGSGPKRVDNRSQGVNLIGDCAEDAARSR